MHTDVGVGWRIAEKESGAAFFEHRFIVQLVLCLLLDLSSRELGMFRRSRVGRHTS
jgi:hypothetical protein